ncbi:RNA polymerase sigma factor [Bacteroides sp. 224]|uniref:RNA polymerase sigma factor n=1 Tax=Bacteroides sp. 224 TaxID=2302936 RepID=UPI0013D8B545|nr:sigma-70 family RNA polymerase sigma factor [Bacteroides sp. 224]NDV66939.1 sigma-70 family RNA polymerase sigma factor [Bacteroides sp. 224]
MEINVANEVISLIRDKNDSEIKRIYYLYRESFFRYGINRFELDEDTLSDIYQESFISLYDNIRKGKLTNLSCSLKTYLFKIGTNQILSYLKKNDKYPHVPIDQTIPELNAYHNSDEWTKVQEIVFHTVSTIEHPCNEIFNLYYWQQLKMNEIAQTMGYKNEQVAKNRKSICLKNLKEHIFGTLKKEDLL